MFNRDTVTPTYGLLRDRNLKFEMITNGKLCAPLVYLVIYTSQALHGAETRR